MSKTCTINKRQPDGRWPKGTPGNATGRPPGSRNKSTLFFEELLNGRGEALIQKAVALALKGDTTALRICLDRICPPRKERTLDIHLPDLTGPEQVSAALASIVTALGEGRITPGEAESLVRILESRVRIIEVEDLARRICELESQHTAAPDLADQAARESETFDWVSRNYRNRDLDSETELGSESENGATTGIRGMASEFGTDNGAGDGNGTTPVGSGAPLPPPHTVVKNV